MVKKEKNIKVRRLVTNIANFVGNMFMSQNVLIIWYL
jgi:hypothetical protein